MTDLSTVSTRELCDELAKRDGVEEYVADAYKPYFVEVWGKNSKKVTGEGECRILVVTD